MTVQDVINHLEELAPLAQAEDFDNVGLLVGSKNTEVTGILVCLDTLEAVVEEAIDKNCNFILSFHPIIFKGLKSLTGKTYVERTVLKAIQNNIAIYAIHTALDKVHHGVNDIICNRLQLADRQILLPQKSTISKLQFYVPSTHTAQVKTALFKAGAGNIGNYDHCSFSFKGEGTFRGNALSNPTIGQAGEMEKVSETAVAVTFNKYQQEPILKALFTAHPYEEVAYEVSTLDNANQNVGMGMIGRLKEPMPSGSFLKFAKERLQSPMLRHSALVKNKIERVAVLGGSGSFAIGAAKRAKADVFITADLKYHDFFRAEKQMILADVGHYESEQFTKSFLVDYLSKKITNFAIILSNTNTNPVKYL